MRHSRCRIKSTFRLGDEYRLGCIANATCSFLDGHSADVWLNANDDNGHRMQSTFFVYGLISYFIRWWALWCCWWLHFVDSNCWLKQFFFFIFFCSAGRTYIGQVYRWFGQRFRLRYCLMACVWITFVRQCEHEASMKGDGGNKELFWINTVSKWIIEWMPSLISHSFIPLVDWMNEIVGMDEWMNDRLWLRFNYAEETIIKLKNHHKLWKQQIITLITWHLRRSLNEISAKAPPMEPTLPVRISSVYRLAGAVCHLQLLVHDFLFIIFPSRSSFQAPKKPMPFRAVCVSGSVCAEKQWKKNYH